MHKPPLAAAEVIRAAGLKRTEIRIGVLDLFLRDRQPHSALKILAKLPKGTDKVTLYRTLKSFVRLKLLHRVRGEDQAWRYGLGEMSAARHDHAHFVCDDCGTVECLPDAAVRKKKVKPARLRTGYRVAYSEVLVHGSCPDCRS